MKKCSFLSPEALLQAEIFGSGGSGGNSNIIEVSDQFEVGSGSQQISGMIDAYWNNNTHSGIFLARIMPNDNNSIYITTSSGASIVVTSNFISNNTSATFDDTGSPMIYFNEVNTGEGIIVSGMLIENNR